jgi:hypothetical protein
VYCSQACQERVAMGRRWARRQADYDWKVPRTCARPGCGVVFTPSQNRVITCSTKCRDWLYHGTKEPSERTCARVGCGRTFVSRIRNRQWCSDICERRVNQPRRFQRMIDKRVEAALRASERVLSERSIPKWDKMSDDQKIAGAYLLVSPQTVSNKELSKAMGRENDRAFEMFAFRVRKLVRKPGKTRRQGGVNLHTD